MVIGINESKTLTKHISCECKCRFDGRKCNSDQWWNKNKCQCECEKCCICEKGYIWNPSTCTCKNGKCLASIIDDATIKCDEVIESYNKEINFNEKKATCKTQHFYILFAFLLITVALLIAASIYYSLVKYRAKQKNLLAFHNRNNGLGEVLY